MSGFHCCTLALVPAPPTSAHFPQVTANEFKVTCNPMQSHRTHFLRLLVHCVPLVHTHPKGKDLRAVNMSSGLCGTWDIISNVNFEGYMIVLGIHPNIRKIALKLKQRKIIEQQGELFIIKTLSTFRNYTLSFSVGQEFEEFTQGLDNKHVKSLVLWEGNKLVCKQIGEKMNRGWTHWIEDDKLHLELFCEGERCRQVFKKKASE